MRVGLGDPLDSSPNEVSIWRDFEVDETPSAVGRLWVRALVIRVIEDDKPHSSAHPTPSDHRRTHAFVSFDRRLIVSIFRKILRTSLRSSGNYCFSMDPRPHPSTAPRHSQQQQQQQVKRCCLLRLSCFQMN